MRRILILGLVAVLLLGLNVSITRGAIDAAQTKSAASTALPHWAWSVPFVVVLLCIAVGPLAPRLHHYWERNSVKLGVSLVLGGLILLYYGLRGRGIEHGGHVTAPGGPTVAAVLNHAILEDYVPFLTLLFSLYVIAGGIQLKGDVRALPSVNVLFLAIGTVLASIIGTTGASMVLIRPLLQTNQERTKVSHTVIFFIFLVSNIGGSLLPLGDPPLFLGYLKGVPFLWTLSMWKPWLFCSTVLLIIYYFWDKYWAWPHEPPQTEAADRGHIEPLRLRGQLNFVWLLLLVLVVGLVVPGKALPGTSWIVPRFFREALMLALVGISLRTTPRGLREEVEFNYHAIAEVAALFLGIFLTMQVPLEILHIQGPNLGLHAPRPFFWATGLLSSFLDNAPTYLVFLATAQTLPIPANVARVPLDSTGIAHNLLLAISMGAVFMGANTYIGNGPNFMVKAIAEHHGVKMPGFFKYMLYSGLILVPLFVVVGYLFL